MSIRAFTVLLHGGKEVHCITDSYASKEQIKKLIKSVVKIKEKVADVFCADVEHGKRYVYLDIKIEERIVKKY